MIKMLYIIEGSNYFFLAKMGLKMLSSEVFRQHLQQHSSHKQPLLKVVPISTLAILSSCTKNSKSIYKEFRDDTKVGEET